MFRHASILIFFTILFFQNLQAQSIQKRDVDLMGSKFSITIVHHDSLQGEQFIDQVIQEIDRIGQLISDWKPESQISEVNRNAGIKPVQVDKEVFDLVKRALFFSTISDGAFDISTASMDKIWKFDGSMDTLPSAEKIQNSIRNVGFQNIILDSSEHTIFLKKSGMKIGLGATGKGYAADKGREFLQKLGIEAGIIDASGDLALWGHPPKQCFWKIGINDPEQPYQSADILKMRNAAVATSGDYQKFIEIDDKRYAHIIDPKTGMPVQGITSVTVFGPSTEFANGLSTSIMVLGIDEGLKLLSKYSDYAALIISSNGEKIKSSRYKKVKRRIRKS